MVLTWIFMEEEFEGSTALKFRTFHICSVREKIPCWITINSGFNFKKHPVVRCITSWLGVYRVHLQVLLSYTPLWRHSRGLPHLHKVLELCTHIFVSTHNQLRSCAMLRLSLLRDGEQGLSSTQLTCFPSWNCAYSESTQLLLQSTELCSRHKLQATRFSQDIAHDFSSHRFSCL